MEVRVILKDIVALLIEHGVNVEVDSAQLEITGDEIVFRCRDLNRTDWKNRRWQEAIEKIRDL